jgi:hypothetical protein
LDEEFAAIADEAPGFAGMYFDTTGTLVVRSVSSPSLSAIRAAVDARGGATLPVRARQALASAQVRSMGAEFDFRQLLEWKRLMYRSVPLTGVVFVDIDEVRNELRIGTVRDDQRALLVSALQRLGIPDGAFRVTSGHTGRRTQLLSDRFRPIPGGVKVGVITTPQGGGEECTITANLRIDGDDYFMTCSHCSYRFGDGGDGSAAYQNNLRASGDLVGYEAYDPDLFAPGYYDCPSKSPLPGDTTTIRGCRFSDAAVFVYAYSNVAQFGTIARTTGVGSKTISSSSPRFFIASESLEYPLVGTSVNMMGYQSGWQTGSVTYGQEVWPGVDNTCVDAFFPEDPIGSLCQAVGDYENGPGDSGAPIFTWGGSGGDIELVGINVGELDERSVFSPWVYVSLELVGETGEWEIVY